MPIATRRRATALPPDERRAMIVQAVLPLVLQHGEAVTTRQIAQAAGIAEGTIFRVFTDKEELLDAVLDAGLDPATLELAISDIDQSIPLADAVTRAVSLVQRRSEEVWRLITSIGTRRLDRRSGPMPESAALARLFEHYGQELRVSPRVAARLLHGVTLAMSHPMMVERPVPAREIADLCLHGVARGAAA